MTHNEAQTADLSLFQGLIENEGRSYSNWGQHRRTTPAVLAEPITYADVQSLVRDDARFPTPVNPIGSIMSVSSTFVNDGGTMVCLRKLDEVIGNERDAAGREVVRVQAGCRLKKLNSWLQSRGLEIPFQAEIGEASVGSVAAGDTKESSLDGPGYFSAHVVAVTYVDENGILRTLADLTDGAAFHEFKCSFGLSGIIVECLVETRPATLCRSDISVEAFATPVELAAALLTKHSQCDALLAIVFLHQLASFFDQRFKAGPGVYTPPESQPECDAFRLAKRLAIQHGFDQLASFFDQRFKAGPGVYTPASKSRSLRESSIRGLISSTNTGARARMNGGLTSNITSTTSRGSKTLWRRPTPSPSRFRNEPDMCPAAGPPTSCGAWRKRKNPSGSILAVLEFHFPSTPSAQTRRTLCGSSSRANITSLLSIGWALTPRRSKPNG
jgi:FAD/FMN-containing dehydrogenase